MKFATDQCKRHGKWTLDSNKSLGCYSKDSITDIAKTVAEAHKSAGHQEMPTQAEDRDAAVCLWSKAP